jgi:hypothetical protein
MSGVGERRPSSALRGSDGGRSPRRCDPKDDFRSTDGGMALAAADGAFGDGTSADAASRRTTGSGSEGSGGGVGAAAAALLVSGWNLTPGGTAEDCGAEPRHRRAEVGRDEDDGRRREAIENASSFDEQPSSSVAGRLPPPPPRSLSTGDGRLEKTSMEPVVEATEELTHDSTEEEEDSRRSRRDAARRAGRLPLEERPGRVSAGGPARRRCGRPTTTTPGDDLTDIDPTDLPDDDLTELSSSVW